jgi:hypothetical protein
VVSSHERPVHAEGPPAMEWAYREMAVWHKKSIAIKYLGVLPRNRWNFGHTVAFLLDSQAKNY